MMKRATLALAILLAISGFRWIIVGVRGGGGVPHTFTSVSLSCGTSCSFTVGGGATIGTASATLSSGAFTGTFSLQFTGVDHSGTVCDTHSTFFSISGNTVSSTSSAAAGTFQLCVVVTQAGVSNSPFVQAITITGTGGSASINSVSLSCGGSCVFTAGNVTTIGTASAILSSGTFSGTFSLQFTGLDHSGTTCNTHSTFFSISGSTVSSTASSTAGTYQLCVVATQSGLVNSPFVQAIAVVGSSGGGTTISLTRTFNNPGAGATGSTAFWSIGQPFKPGEVPAGTTITATLGGTSVPVDCAERKFAANGDLEWCHLLVDFSGKSVAGSGGTQLLQLTSATGTWCDLQGNNTCASGFTKTSWDTQGDSVTLANVGFGPPKIPGVSCTDFAGGFTTGTRVYVVTSYTTAAGETLPSVPVVIDVVNAPSSLVGRCLFSGTTGSVTVNPPDSLSTPGFGLTGWKVYACSTTTSSATGCSNFTLQGTQTGFTAPFTFSAIAGGAAPLSVPTSGPIAASIVGSGTWKATFDGGVTNQETIIADTPQGREVSVTANLVDQTAIASFNSATWSAGTETISFSSAPSLVSNDGIVLNGAGGALATCYYGNIPISNPIMVSGLTITCPLVSNPGTVTSVSAINRNIRVEMYYWATCKVPSPSSTVCTTAGPVESWGPFIENVLLYPRATTPYLANSSVSTYTFDSEYDRGATKVRGSLTTCGGASPVNVYCGATLYFLSVHPLMRVDAQGDWTANDPGIYVTDDYGNVVDTKKVPPYKKGISYQADTGTGTSIFNTVALTGFTTPVLKAQQNVLSSYVSPIDFVSVGSLGNVTACTGPTSCPIYWAVPAQDPGNGPFFCLYDTAQHGIASGVGGPHAAPSSCSGTGLITPTGTFTGASIENAIAPMAVAPYDRFIQDAGGRPDLAIAAEWSVGYVVGGSTNNTHNTQQAWEHIGKITAYAWSAMQDWAVDALTGHIPCLIDQHGGAPGSGDVGCPGTSVTAPLGAAYPTTQWGGSFTNDLNGGNAALDSIPGPWQTGLFDYEHYGNSVYLVWLMTGDPFLRELSLYMANAALGNSQGLRTVQVTSSNSKWYGTSIFAQGALRAGAWKTRDIANAAMVALNGSPEEAYFRTSLASNASAAADYEAYKPATFANFATLSYDESNGPTNIGSNFIAFPSIGQVFELGYLNTSLAWQAMLESDYIPGLLTQATKWSGWLSYIFGTVNCPYYALMQNFVSGISPFSDPLPGRYIASFSRMGLSTSGNYLTFTSGSSTLQFNSFDNVNNFPWSVAAGDKVRMMNYDPDTNSISGELSGVMGPPGSFTMGTEYCIVGTPDAVNLRFQLATTCGGTPIVAAYGAWPGASQTVQFRGAPIKPTNNNTHNDFFQMFVNFPSVTGATEPNWDLNCATQCTDGAVTWQNLGTAVARTPIVLIPDGQASCPPGFPAGATSTGTGPGGYLQNLNFGMVMDAQLGITGMKTAADNGLAVFTGDCSTAMFWCGLTP